MEPGTLGARLRASDRSRDAGTRAIGAGELAWIAALPCALVTVVCIVALGPALGHAFLAPGAQRIWPPEAPWLFGHPEPTKHARFLIALGGPVLLAGVVVTASRRRLRLPDATIRALVRTSQTLTLAFVVVAILGQSNLIAAPRPPQWSIFSRNAYAVAALLTVLPLWLLRRPAVSELVARCVRETRARRIACLCIAGAATSTWLLTAVMTDQELVRTGMQSWTMDDPFAVLNGRTPLVDYMPVYAHVQPYLEAAAMYVLGTTAFVYSTVMVSCSGLTLLAVYAVLRRVTRSSLLGLVVFLPTLATGFLLGDPDPRPTASNVTLFSVWPIRYGGSYLLAWLTARHLDAAVPRRAAVLLAVAGLVLIDNTEFGSAAVAATLVALAAAQRRPTRATLSRLAADAAVGLLAAGALVALLTLVRAGRLPAPGSLTEFPNIYGILGLVGLPMPPLGFHLVVYATFVAAIGVAAVRFAARTEDVLLTGMLGWSGTFGLIAGGYYSGRSEVGKLVALFSAWSFALALLTIAVARGLAARGWRRPRLAEVLVLFGFGLAICSLAQIPAPWSQVSRLSAAHPGEHVPLPQPFLAQHTRRGERVAILTPFSQRISYELGLVNVARYSFLAVMATKPQMLRLLDQIRREGAHAVFFPGLVAAHRRMLTKAGFSEQASEERVEMWTG